MSDDSTLYCVIKVDCTFISWWQTVAKFLERYSVILLRIFLLAALCWRGCSPALPFFFQIPRRCFSQFTWIFPFFPLETLAWFCQCALDCYHARIFLSCQASGGQASSCQPVYWYIHGHSWCNPEMSSPQHSLHACSPTSSRCHHRASLSGPCTHFGVTGQVQAKHASTHVSRTNRSWTHLNKECVPSIHRASFHVL